MVAGGGAWALMQPLLFQLLHQSLGNCIRRKPIAVGATDQTGVHVGPIQRHDLSLTG